MSLARFSTAGKDPNSPGNLVPTTQFYYLDRTIVLDQDGVTSAGLLNWEFRDDPVTVFAARDINGDVLPLVALPCPPYHHDTHPEAQPGNILEDH